MKKFAAEKQSIQALVAAMKSGDEKEMQKFWEEFHASVAEEVRADFEALQESQDTAVLAQRGYRQLTSAEKKWYNKFIAAGKSANPKQAFVDLLNSDNEEDFMPTTIIEDVYKNLKDEYPLLNAIKFNYVGHITKWLLNDHSVQKAVWGTITDEIVKEITSSFESFDLKQNKLSAFAIIENSMLDLGPVFLDGYIRTVLAEAIMGGLELAIVAGTGVNEPIGLIRDIHKGVSVSSETGYPAKELIPVTEFSPVSYGALIARMAVTEKGKKRKFSKVTLVCNQTDYLTKVMPATTVLNANGAYVNNLFPFATDVIISNALDDGKAVLALTEEYFFGAGGSKNGVIEHSDQYKFLEDQRVFRVKQYGAGRALDNTSALYLDISNLDPAYITVKQKDATPEA